MKILLVHNRYQFAGGEDLVFESEGQLLRDHGHDVEYLIYDNKNITGSIARWLFGLKLLYNGESAKIFERKLKEFGADIVHVHNFMPIASPSIFFSAKKLNVPVVVTLHNYRLLCPSATLFYNNKIYEESVQAFFPWDAIIKGVYRKSSLETAAVAITTWFHNHIGTWRDKVDKFIVLTEFARKKFTHSTLKIPENAFVVKPNFVVDRGIGDELRSDFFLYVGRLSEEKGISTLLKAVEIGRQKLVIIGDGPMREHVEKYIQSRPHVSYLGYQEKDTVLSYLKKCKALVFPSVWYEGLPMIILEAFSAGTPVIASKLGAMEDIVRHERNGLHFEPGNHNDLANKLLEVYGKPFLTGALSRNAREDYMKLYSPEVNYPRLMEIYEQVYKANLNVIDSYEK